MNKIIHLVTGNTHKVEIAKAALAPFGFGVEQINIDTPEIQSDSVAEVAKFSAKFAAEKTNLVVIKGDVGMNIEALKGFPGPFIKYINKWLTAEQFISLYINNPNKKASFVDALGYCEPGQKPVCFITQTNGRLVTEISGDNGNMADALFIPNGYNKTIASLSKEEAIGLWSNDRYIQLSTYLQSKNK